MKIKTIIIIILSSMMFSQGYNVQLLSHLPYGQETSDITGFYQDGREIAVMGLQNATAIIDVTDVANVKVQFGWSINLNGGTRVTYGDSTKQETGFTFVRLGDT